MFLQANSIALNTIYYKMSMVQKIANTVFLFIKLVCIMNSNFLTKAAHRILISTNKFKSNFKIFTLNIRNY